MAYCLLQWPSLLPHIAPCHAHPLPHTPPTRCIYTPARHAPQHACPLPCMPPPPCMPPCHACPLSCLPPPCYPPPNRITDARENMNLATHVYVADGKNLWRSIKNVVKLITIRTTVNLRYTHSLRASSLEPPLQSLFSVSWDEEKRVITCIIVLSC